MTTLSDPVDSISLLPFLKPPQAVFNEEIFLPSHGKYLSSEISVRIMDIYEYVNSKTLFRTMRYDRQYEKHMPVMVSVEQFIDGHSTVQDEPSNSHV